MLINVYTYIYIYLVPEIWEAPIDGQLKIQLFNTGIYHFPSRFGDTSLDRLCRVPPHGYT